MKKMICLILCCVLILSTSLNATATATEQTILLSAMTDEECMAFLEQSRVVVPEGFVSEGECIDFVRYVIEKVEQDSSVRFHFGYKYLQEFALEIKNAVIEYYGISSISSFAMIRDSINILEDNEVTGPWTESYRGYNCYGYAIGYIDWIEPGQVKWKENGGTGFFPSPVFVTMVDMVQAIKEDLEALGYTSVTYSTYLLDPNVTVTAHNRVICVRRVTNTSGDFHFMVLKEDGYWYHKPGASTPLRYAYTPSSELGWVREGLDGVGFFRDEDYVYEGTIYFIHYTIPCVTYRYKYSGNDQHIYACEDCGKVVGESSSCTYNYRHYLNNTHKLTCSLCHNTTGMATPCKFVNKVCKICGNRQQEDNSMQSIGG